jgi:phospholipid/cholesterol/gamma-HCH transport system ATP-binding protein
MIELIDVHKKYNGKSILNSVSFKVRKGEVFVIIGRSGTGKTVTLRHIAGLVEPDSGQVLISGIQMNGAGSGVKEKLRLKMGFVFQSGALINWMSVRDNIALYLKEHKLHTPKEIDRIVDDNLKMLQLDDAGDKMPSDISGGMKKRAALARALVKNPDILLYDEPTSGLDPVISNVINELIRRMQREFDVTSIVVTHDMQSAYYIADRIAMIYNGEIIECDVPEKIRNTENPIVRQFINGDLQGPMNLD